jgi:hypothetical protein
MSERVEQFLITLSQDPVLLDDFLDDPEPLLKDSLLTEKEKDLLRSGDAEQIRRHLGDEGTIVLTNSTATKSPPPGPRPDPHPGPPPGPPKH